MTTQFSFQLADQPGALAGVAEIFASKNINIDGFAGVSANGKGFIKVFTQSVESAENALKEAEVDFEKQQVLLLSLKDEPGQIAKISRALSEEGINIDALYITMEGKQVIHTNDLKRTQEIAKDLDMV